jgi:putative oxidoreductase
MDINAIRILSFSLGFLLLFHGVDKVLNGMGFIEEMLESANVPYAKYVSYGVFIGEIIAPLLLIANQYIKIAGGLIAFNMIVAIMLAHKDTIFTLSEHGGWSIELQLLYLISGLTIAISGARK